MTDWQVRYAISVPDLVQRKRRERGVGTCTALIASISTLKPGREGGERDRDREEGKGDGGVKADTERERARSH
eukprot:2310076-Rhodomonas_salina.1